MTQHQTSPERGPQAASAQIVDFAAARADLRRRWLTAHEQAAAEMLASCRSGQASLNELMRALIAPFHRELR